MAKHEHVSSGSSVVTVLEGKWFVTYQVFRCACGVETNRVALDRAKKDST